MKVKELIEYLKKCNPDYEVRIEDCYIGGIVEHNDITEPTESHVNIWSR